MKVSFSKSPATELRLIDEIPDLDFCLLEGENGIGKTLSIQLLELLCGSTPKEFDRTPALWESLKQRLATARVEISALPGGQVVAATFTPDDWPEVPSVDHELAEVAIDGVPATLAELRQLVSVERISGTEDLESTLRRRVESLKLQLGRSGRNASQGVTAIESASAALLQTVAAADAASLRTEKQDLELAREEENTLRDALNEAERRLRLILDALEARHRIESLGREAQELIAERKKLLLEIDLLDKHLAEAEARAKAADEKYSKQGGSERKLVEAERLLRIRQRRLSNAAAALRVTLHGLGLDQDEPLLEEEFKELSNTVERLTKESQSLDRLSGVRSLSADLHRHLVTASGLDNEPIAELNEQLVSVSDLRAGVEKNQTRLRDRGSLAVETELAQKLLTARRRLSAVRNAMEATASHTRAQELVDEAAQEVKAASKGVERASEAAKASQKANVAFGEAKAKLDAAIAHLSQIQTQIGKYGNISEEDASKVLEEASFKFGVPQDELPKLEAGLRSAEASARSGLEEVRRRIAALERLSSNRQGTLEATIDEILSDPQHAWVLDGSPSLRAALTSPNDELRIEALLAVEEALRSATQVASDATMLLSGLQGIAEQYFETPRSTQSEFERTYRPVFEDVVGKNLMSVLNRPALRARLFGDGHVSGIDAGARILVLTTSDGEDVVRPMEAFSTGEQALAFTQARIADLPRAATASRLIVLDEFGAFVSADRFPDLIDFLREIKTGADQFLVILPLQVDYEKELPETKGALFERYTKRSESIQDRGYFTEAL